MVAPVTAARREAATAASKEIPRLRRMPRQRNRLSRLSLKARRDDDAGAWNTIGAALCALIATPRAFDEIPRLIDGAAEGSGYAALRWGAVALAALFLAQRAERPVVRRLGQGFAAALLYGAAAQLLPDTMLVLVPAIGGAALLLAARRIAPARIDAGAAVFAAISLAWAAAPMALWTMKAALSLGGVPMGIDDAMLAAASRRVPLWRSRAPLPRSPARRWQGL